jgi:hypothetical protein
LKNLGAIAPIIGKGVYSLPLEDFLIYYCLKNSWIIIIEVIVKFFLESHR